MEEPLETSELMAFVQTVDAKSLSHAAKALGVPRATISRRLARLEERLQVRLLKRTTRSLSVTDAGQALYAHAQRVLEALTFAEECVKQKDGGVRGELRVSVPPMQSEAFRQLIIDFCRQYPDVRVSIQFSSAYVDLLGAGYDVALRASTRLEPGLVSKTLLRARVGCVASPAYLAAKGTPKTVADLKRHTCLMAFAKGEIPETEWPLLGGGRVRVEGRLHSNDLTMLRDATASGMGISLLPEIVTQEAISRGMLVPVLADVVGAETRMSIVYAERELMPAQVRAFIDMVSRWAPTGLAIAAKEGRATLLKSVGRTKKGAPQTTAHDDGAEKVSRTKRRPSKTRRAS